MLQFQHLQLEEFCHWRETAAQEIVRATLSIDFEAQRPPKLSGIAMLTVIASTDARMEAFFANERNHRQQLTSKIS